MNRGGIALATLAAVVPGTYFSSDQRNTDAIGAYIFTNITANPGGTGTLTVTIQAKDQVSGNYVDLLTSAAFSTVAQQQSLYMLPGTVETANQRASFSLPAVWRIKYVVGGSGSISGTISGETCAEGPTN